MRMRKIQALLHDFGRIRNEWKSEGGNFNFFRFIEENFQKQQITETKHSRILAFLLDPGGSHGQGGAFLKLFLQRLGFKVSNFNADKWKVRLERDHIDILLRSDTISIVIENKSNGAIDQRSQLYRYWYSGIYKFHQRNLRKATDRNLSRILYLPDGCWFERQPMEEAKARPDNWPADKYPEKLNEKIITVWTYMDDIQAWLKECTVLMNDGHVVKHFISSYMNYWSAIKLKEGRYMVKLEDYLKNKEDWNNLSDLADYLSKLKVEWNNDFADKLEDIELNHLFSFAKYIYKNEKYYTDFRWGIGEEGNGIVFGFDYLYGVSIWKNGFYKNKEKYKKSFVEIFESDFEWNNDDNKTSGDYIMFLKRNISWENEDDFIWDCKKNKRIINIITDILQKYTYDPKVHRLFRRIRREVLY